MLDRHDPLENPQEPYGTSDPTKEAPASGSESQFAKQYEMLVQHNRWLSDLNETTAQMLQHESVGALLQYIATELVEVSCANGAYMHMVHETGDYLDVLAAHGPLSDSLIGERRYWGVGFSAKVWQSGETKHVENYNDDPDCLLELDSIIQAAALPLSFAGEVLGVVFVTAEQGQPLLAHLDLLKQVAVVASLSIHHARQKEVVARELIRTQSLSEISTLLYQIQNWDDLALHVCPRLFDVLDLSRASLFNVDMAKNELSIYASWERSAEGVEKVESINSDFIKETISYWCFQNEQPALIERKVDDPRQSNRVNADRRKMNIGCSLSVPVLVAGKVRGILNVFRPLEKRDFDENDVNTIHTVIGQLSTALQRHELLCTVQHQAVHDSLTDLPNRRGLENYLTACLEDQSEADTLKAILFFDLDGFKEVNDTHGHAAGDDVLKQVSSRLSNLSGERELLARLGGDEFAVVLPKISHYEDAVTRAEIFSASFTESFEYEGHFVQLGVSTGISFYPRDGVNMDDLISNADMAMYQAKRKGRNNIVQFDKDQATTLREEISHEKELRKAVSDQQFDLWYQPQISLTTGLVEGAEALIRWQHPTKGILPPTKFIPLAEELGLISLVGTWVLENGCRQMVDWKNSDPIPWHLGINVAAPQFMTKGFAESVLRVLEVYDIEPSQLQLEVTESVLINDLQSVVRNLYLLRSNGVRIALDDFGTGYSSLQYLQELPLDLLKIDRSFISKLEAGSMLDSLANVIVDLANRFGLKTVAEGVETAEQLELVKQLNCDLVQGFYFSKPVVAADLPTVISTINQSGLMDRKVA